MKCLLAGNRPRLEVLPAPPPPHSAPAQPHKPRPGSSPPFPRGGPSSGLGAGPARDPGGCWQRRRRRRRRLRLRGLGRNQGQVAESSEAEPSRPASPPTRSDSLGGRALQPAPPRPSRSPGGGLGLSRGGPGAWGTKAGGGGRLFPRPYPAGLIGSVSGARAGQKAQLGRRDVTIW